jgi:hypothetical protein
VPGHRPVRGLGGPVADHHHALDLPGVLAAAAGTAPGPAGAQAAGQLAAQLAAALHVQRLVDGLVAHMHHGIAWVLDPQPGRDLHRRPPSGQPGRDLGGQLRTGQLGRLGPPGLLASALMRPPRPVPTAAAVGGHLPRHGGDRLAQPGGDRGERLPGVQAERDFLPVGHRQPPRAGHPAIVADRPLRGMAHDQRHPLVRAAHLRPDLPQRQAPGLQPQRQLPLLYRQMRPHPQPPQLIENPLDSPRRCADRLKPPRQRSVGARHAIVGPQGQAQDRRR